MEDRMTHNDLLHEELLRLGNNKRLALDKVCVCVHACICVWVYKRQFNPLSLLLSRSLTEQNRSPKDENCIL